MAMFNKMQNLCCIHFHYVLGEFEYFQIKFGLNIIFYIVVTAPEIGVELRNTTFSLERKKGDVGIWKTQNLTYTPFAKSSAHK